MRRLLLLSLILVCSGCGTDSATPIATLKDAQAPSYHAVPQDHAAQPKHGDVTGVFRLEGAVPKQRILVHAEDDPAPRSSECGIDTILSEQLIVDAKTKGIANVFIYKLKAAASVHPESQTAREQEIVCRLSGYRFEPHASIVHTTQHVVIKAKDKCAHHAHAFPIRGLAH